MQRALTIAAYKIVAYMSRTDPSLGRTASHLTTILCLRQNSYTNPQTGAKRDGNLRYAVRIQWLEQSVDMVQLQVEKSITEGLIGAMLQFSNTPVTQRAWQIGRRFWPQPDLMILRVVFRCRYITNLAG
jgi:hypothetical protein